MALDLEWSALQELFLLAFIPLADGSQITYHPGIDFAGFAADRTGGMFANLIAVIRAYTESRRDGKVGKAVLAANCLDKAFDDGRVVNSLPNEQMEYCTACVFSLQLVL